MLNQPNPNIPDKFVACLIDISEYCSPELLERCGGKAYYSGFFNDAVNTYCCSMTPSVFVDVIELVPEQYPEDEDASNALNEELLELLTPDDGGYYDRRDVERMKGCNPERFRVLDLSFDEDEADQERCDGVREYLQGNPCF